MFSPRLFSGRYAPVVSRPVTERRVVSYVPASQIQEEIDKAFGSMFRMMAPWTGNDDDNLTQLMPRLDVASDDKAYTISTELPGVRPEDVSLEVKDGLLTIKGEKKQENKDDGKDVHVSERSYGSFERILTLPEDAVIDEIRAGHKDGVLTVTVPRKEPEQPQAKTIEITKE